MSCTCGDISCTRRMPCESDLEKLKDLYRELYARHAARLVVRRLDKVESHVHSFYHDTRTKDRIYLPDVEVSIFGPFEGWTRNLTFFGIDNEKALVFVVALPILEDLGWMLKAGDLIVYQGVEHEVLKIGQKEDSFYAQWNYNFELNVATYVPNRGS